MFEFGIPGNSTASTVVMLRTAAALGCSLDVELSPREGGDDSDDAISLQRPCVPLLPAHGGFANKNPGAGRILNVVQQLSVTDRVTVAVGPR